MVAHVKVVQRRFQRGNQLWVTMPEIVGSAVQMQVNQAPTRHIVKVVTFAPVDHQIDAGILPELCLSGVPVFDCLVEQLGLRFEVEKSIVEHERTSVCVEVDTKIFN